MGSNDNKNAKSGNNKPQGQPIEGACIITFDNGSKECVVNKTESECQEICNEAPGAECESTSANICPRGN